MFFMPFQKNPALHPSSSSYLVTGCGDSSLSTKAQTPTSKGFCGIPKCLVTTYSLWPTVRVGMYTTYEIKCYQITMNYRTNKPNEKVFITADASLISSLLPPLMNWSQRYSNYSLWDRYCHVSVFWSNWCLVTWWNSAQQLEDIEFTK